MVGRNSDMSKLVIQKSIPIPPARGNQWGRGAEYASAMRNMACGDSFVVPANKLPNIYTTCKRNGWKVATRKLDQKIEGLAAIRVWKIK